MSWPSREHHAGETLLWELDAADRLNGATIAGVGTAILLDVQANLAYGDGLAGVAAFTGTKVRQKVTSLVVGRRYLLVIPFTDSAGNVQVGGLFLECAS